MTKEEAIEFMEASKQLYLRGMERGMQFALGEVRAHIKDAIRMGITSCLYKYDASEEHVDAVYQEWCRKNSNGVYENARKNKAGDQRG